MTNENIETMTTNHTNQAPHSASHSASWVPAPPSAPEGAIIETSPNSKTIEAPSGAVGGAGTSGAKGLLAACCLLLMTGLTACGDYWEAGDPTAAGNMTLERRVVNLVVGDRYKIPVVFFPDKTANKELWWRTGNEQIARFSNDSIVAYSEGTTLAYATSVSDRRTDSCLVNVLPMMYDNPYLYPYDMVVYADVTVHGKKYTKADEDSLIICAYHYDELRGIGKMRRWKDIDYMEIRIWNPFRNLGRIALRCYYRGKALIEQHPSIIEFDGRARGTLSDLIPLDFDDSAMEYIPGEDDDIVVEVDTIAAN